MNTTLNFKEQTATSQEVIEHLWQCNENHSPVLSEKVDLSSYSRKIREKAITFEAWSGNVLIGLVAAYLDDVDGGYITNVSVVNAYMGKGVANQLMKMCIAHADQKGFDKLTLEVSIGNSKAIQLYKKFHFVQYQTNNNSTLMKLEFKK
jgi:ribosomal protein S18 acetylase RimI-like enzyme